MVTAGYSFIGSRLQKKLGIEIDPDEVVLNLMKFAANRPDQRLIRMWAEGGAETIDWILDMTEAAGMDSPCPVTPPPRVSIIPGKLSAVYFLP